MLKLCDNFDDSFSAIESSKKLGVYQKTSKTKINPSKITLLKYKKKIRKLKDENEHLNIAVNTKNNKIKQLEMQLTNQAESHKADRLYWEQKQQEIEQQTQLLKNQMNAVVTRLRKVEEVSTISKSTLLTKALGRITMENKHLICPPEHWYYCASGNCSEHSFTECVWETCYDNIQHVLTNWWQDPSKKKVFLIPPHYKYFYTQSPLMQRNEETGMCRRITNNNELIPEISIRRELYNGLHTILQPEHSMSSLVAYFNSYKLSIQEFVFAAESPLQDHLFELFTRYEIDASKTLDSQFILGFHGVGESDYKKIFKNRLQLHYSVEGRFGRGIYIAQDPTYCYKNYTTSTNKYGRVLLPCLVFIGTPRFVNPEEVSVDKLCEFKGEMVTSLTFPAGRHMAFVVPRSEQILILGACILK